MTLSKIHHIAIIVSDYEAAKDFYDHSGVRYSKPEIKVL